MVDKHNTNFLDNINNVNNTGSIKQENTSISKDKDINNNNVNKIKLYTYNTNCNNNNSNNKCKSNIFYITKKRKRENSNNTNRTNYTYRTNNKINPNLDYNKYQDLHNKDINPLNNDYISNINNTNTFKSKLVINPLSSYLTNFRLSLQNNIDNIKHYGMIQNLYIRFLFDLLYNRLDLNNINFDCKLKDITSKIDLLKSNYYDKYSYDSFDLNNVNNFIKENNISCITLSEMNSNILYKDKDVYNYNVNSNNNNNNNSNSNINNNINNNNNLFIQQELLKQVLFLINVNSNNNGK